ncbi:hypothetical protein PLICRDRAFT_176579 [Plicaturopsis crispa FD-325 SS-3]|nr:hypothetical protein PLICRDRAFT_176579 [Plicaturopsis crispa FD-325 SS-3]
MGRKQNRVKAAAARAREGKASRRAALESEQISEPRIPDAPEDQGRFDCNQDDEEDDGECHWTGSVNDGLPDTGIAGDDFSESDSEMGSEDELEELEGEELLDSLGKSMDTVGPEQAASAVRNAFDRLQTSLTPKEWAKAEANRHLGYNGQSARTQRRKDEQARAKERVDAKMRQTKGADLMRAFFQPKSRNDATPLPHSSTSQAARSPSESEAEAIFTGYLSDVSEDDDEDMSGADTEGEDNEDELHPEPENASPVDPVSTESNKRTASDVRAPASFRIRPAPRLKRRKLDTPARVARLRASEARATALAQGLSAIDKLIASKRDVFHAGRNSLQAYRARAIQSCLHMVVKNKRKLIDASERAAESQGFAQKWGGRLVRKWVRKWLSDRVLPESRMGSHAKAFTLLNDPAVCAELRSYVRSNKWAMDPAKLSDFSKDKMVPDVADKYLRNIVNVEIPNGLKKYLDTELLPRAHLKAAKGISLRTARRWLHREGFQYTEHKKSLYYDGHERPDVVHYRQNVFLPAMADYRRRLVEYVVGDVEKEVYKPLGNFVERPVVLAAHDEMTCQQNDGPAKSWVLDGEHLLKKKGVGRGIHRSDVICSTYGHLKDAGQSLEYGKNYEGYWTGELFVKQLTEKIIPTFERVHGPGYQMLLMVDNSQGHSAYAVDALLTSRMNMRPGGKQAHLRDGWYMRAGEKVTQKMDFPQDHDEFPGMPKGMKQVLVERGLWTNNLRMQCKTCDPDAKTCCAKRILDLQPDFKEQRSLVQEVVEAAGHLCIFLPKFHCELNFIEFFWGAVKRYLRENCDYTFSTLQENLPNALASVPIETIRKWEHRMIRWMDAYRSGLGAKDAQTKVKQFSSKTYTSHRRVPENVARQFDA